MPDLEPQRLPLVVFPSNRGETTTKDARLVNGYVERVSEKDVWVYKRPGTAVYSTATAGAGSGIYNWLGNIYTIWGNTLYKDNVAIAGIVNTAGGVYTFSQALGATPRLFFLNGAAAYTYDSGAGLVQVTDVDFPTTTVKGSAYLDATTYVMTSAAAINGSALNNPTSWDALNVLTAQIEPDGGVRLAKQLVYVVAFKQWSTEFFYDAANAAGSPLGTVQGAKISIGCKHQDSVAELEGSLFWIAQARGGGVCVMVLDSLKEKVISTPAIERLLQQADYTTVYSWTAKIVGHKFYAVTLTVSNLTLVYDVTTGLWAQWTDTSGNYLPFVGSTFTSAQQPLLQHATNGKVYQLELTYTTDAGDLITFDLYTLNYDGGTRMTKYMHSMDFVADRTAGSILQIRFSDDDYASWSNFREVDLGTVRPRLTQCGSFRRRACNLRHRVNTALRIQAVELQLDMGTL